MYLTSHIAAAVIATVVVLLLSGCLQQNEVKLPTGCNDTNITETCKAKCSDNFNSELDAWRCSGDGHPVCVCKSYKEGSQFIENP